MSIGKRLVDLAKSNLTDFRDALSTDNLRELLNNRAERKEAEREIDESTGESTEGSTGGSTGESIGSKAGKRARKFRDAAEEAWEKAYENARARAGVRGEPSSDPVADRRRWYRTLEVEPGSDLKDVRRAYRKMLLQYHPDRFAQEPDKQKAATEVTRKLTEAYNGLTRYLGG